MSVTPEESRSVTSSTIASRYGLVLFSIYSTIYVGFMLLSALMPATLTTPIFLGLNIAIVYGMGLIGGAVLLSIVYVYLCRQKRGQP